MFYSCLFFAAAGFVYDERREEIKCESCEISIAGDCSEALVFHKQKSPNCAFFDDVLDVQEDSHTSPPAREDSTARPRALSPSRYPRNLAAGPWKYPQYADQSARLSTYEGWPLQAVGQPPDYLSKCGFFYIGSADRVRCFCCGITLRNWEAEDDPYEEHRNWAPRCTFIQTLAKPERHPASTSVSSQNAERQTVTGPTERQDGGSPTSLPSHPPQLQQNNQIQSHTRPSLQQTSHQHTQNGVPLPTLSHPGPSSLPATPGGGRKQDANLDSPTVQAVVSMGFGRDVVEKVWRERCFGGQTLSAKELFLEVENFVQSPLN